ncbi:hypothetical protein D9757_006210 [Collybiopsis confluens]|uniref:Major facilitator superfamily (MFS) profile domain-containing protein n=1 Tax=Collybiopsis confluens TaxID=2823264 RepID=A0A8H5M8G1_9AGAR|nr:hypothetical protein D9757_006210 [Collybiopsis confluens]
MDQNRSSESLTRPDYSDVPSAPLTHAPIVDVTDCSISPHSLGRSDSDSRGPDTQIQIENITTVAGSSNTPDAVDKSSLAGFSDSRSTLETTVTTTTTTAATIPPSASEQKIFPELPTHRLLFAHIGAALTLFLATTDATIVSTSLPIIASDLNASPSQYTWVGVAYLLTQTAFQPIYGRISDVFGRMVQLALYMHRTLCPRLSTMWCIKGEHAHHWNKLLPLNFCRFSTEYQYVSLHREPSVLAARSDASIIQTIRLIASRALAGIGGGGIVSCVWVITAEIVPMKNRAKWSQALSVTWSCSALAGPLLGGLFSGGPAGFVNWRWCFYLNLPVCLFGVIILLVALRGVRLDPPTDASYSLLRKFDFGGLVLFMGGTCCIILGFNFAATSGWKSPSTIVLIVLGLAVLFGGFVYETYYTTRDTLFPPTMFKNRTAVTILVIAFLHNFVFNAGTFYLALFYQAADGYSPLQAGIQMLPYSLGASLASMPTAWFISWWQKRRRDTSGQNIAISAGFLISALGFGLLNILDENSHMTLQIMFPLISGVGLGILFHAPYQVFGKAFKPSELATCTSAFFLVRFTGATVGLAVAGAIFDARMASRITPEMGIDFFGSSIDFNILKSIQPASLRAEILHIVSSSIQTVWIVCTPLLGVAFLLSFLLGKFSIEDVHVHVVSEEKEDEPQPIGGGERRC